jgi:hypothetical protein
MKLRMPYLIQAVFAMLVAVGLSFGASRAFASESTAAAGNCEALGYDYYTPECGDRCLGRVGYCSEGGFCRCGYIP